MNELKLKGWTIKWEGNKEGFVNDNRFVLVDEDRTTLLYLSFESEAFNIDKPTLYSQTLRIDPLNTTITVIDDEEEEYEEDED